MGSSLCPFYEGNDPSKMAMDATLILPTLPHWRWSVAYASATHGIILPATHQFHCICLGNAEDSPVLDFTFLLVTDSAFLGACKFCFESCCVIHSHVCKHTRSARQT